MAIVRDALLAVFVLAVASLVWYLLFKGEIALKDFILAIPALLPLLGRHRTSADTPPVGTVRPDDARPLTPAHAFRLTPSFESGLYGGLIGGALAGVLIGVAYYLTVSADQGSPSLGLIPLIVLYAMLVGAVVGGCSQLGILWCRHAAERRDRPGWVHEVGGGTLGGAVGGILVGALAGWYIGESDLPPVDLPLLVGGTLFGTIFVALGALLYDYHGRVQNVMRAVVISFIITPLLSMLALAIMGASGIGVIAPFGYSGMSGGAILGASIGLIMGLQIGLTQWLYRRWAVLAEPTTP
jgi:hypothetical protein